MCGLGCELRSSSADEILACDAELVENGDVAEKLFHAIRYTRVDAADEIIRFSGIFERVSRVDGGRGEEGAEVTATADGGNLEEFLWKRQLLLRR